MRFLYLAIHHPLPGQRHQLLRAMDQLGTALETAEGMLEATTWTDEERIVAMSIWESREAFTAARPLIGAAIAGVPFDSWEGRPRELFQLDELTAQARRSSTPGAASTSG